MSEFSRKTNLDPSIVLEIERFLTDPNGEHYLHFHYRGVVCKNIRLCLIRIGFNRLKINKLYDKELENTIFEFQKKENHINKDGVFGPLTKRLLATKMATMFGFSSLSGLEEPKGVKPANVFLSYSWSDSETVNKIDQWLRDKAINVKRDSRDFQPGKQLEDLIRDSITTVDKIIIIYSKNSKNRDWPIFERSVAQELEKQGTNPFIIYLVLGDVDLPKNDPNRLAIFAKGKKLKQVGDELLHGILGKKKDIVFDYDDDEIL